MCFNGSCLNLQVPIAAQSGIPRGVGAGGDVGASQLTQQCGRLLPCLAFGEITPIDQNIGRLGETQPDRSQLIRILA